VSHGAAAAVRAVVKTADDFVHVGGAVAKPGCWSMLKGGLTAAKAGRAELYFEVRSINSFAKTNKSPGVVD
jgi:hypothetical protein